jgi:4-amino-4-deoxy-L-arabinose transferase-like glycosyltransferase
VSRATGSRSHKVSGLRLIEVLSLSAVAGDVPAAASLMLRQLCAGLALAVTAFVAGRTLLGWMASGGSLRREATEPRPAARPGPGVVPGGRLATAVLATTLGLVVVAHAGLLLGLAGLLEPAPVLLVLAGIHLASLPGWRSLVQMARALSRPAGDLDGRAGEAQPGGEPGPGPGPRPWPAPRRLVALAAAAAGALPFALLTLYPPTAFDATLYHLPYARAFVAAGAMPFLPDLRIPIFPQLMETLFALLLLAAGELATQTVALLATLLTAALVLAWGRRFSPAAGWIAAATYAGSPVVVYLAGTAYVEPGLVLFATAALYATACWLDGAGPRWLTLAAVFAGAAADTKYLGLFILGLVALAAVAATPPGPPETAAARWRRLATVAVAGGLVIAPWYGRIVAATGNPVFPFLPGVFGLSPWNPLGFHPVADLREHPGAIVLGLLRLPWDAVVARSRLGGSPPYSPIILLGLPALLVGAVYRRRVRVLLLTAAAYAVLVLAMLPDARYLLVALPLVCLALGDSLATALAALARRASRTSRRRQAEPAARVAAAILALAIFLPGWCYAVYRLGRQGPLPATPAERDAYLARALPVYPALRYLDQACGGSYTLYAIHAENMTYFAAGRFLGDWTGPASYTRVLPADGDARLLFGRLRMLGADHLLTVEGDPALPPIFGPAFDGFFQPVYADGRARLFALRGARCGPSSGRQPAGGPH